MKIQRTLLPGVVVVQATPVADHRGEFRRVFCENELSEIIGNRRIVQANISKTRLTGTVRGLHFQNPPHEEMKLVQCLRGRIYDVAVDFRKDSPTFLKWHAEELTPDNHRLLVVPEGCAHGFQTLEPDSELLYLVTAFYTKNAEGGLRYDDPAIGIRWPLKATNISDKDKSLPRLPDKLRGGL